MMRTQSVNRRDFIRRGVSVSLAAGMTGLAQNHALAGYPSYCFTLRVPWLCQLPPGDWNGTKNCGQTCSVMLAGYFKGRPVNSTQITNANSWLACVTGNSAYSSGNGFVTNFGAGNTLGRLLADYFALKYAPACGSDPSVVVNQAAAGRPCIVGVEIGGVTPGVLSSNGRGVQHWALAIGWDGSNVILNDPGNSNGQGIRYTVSAFDASWATSGRTYSPVWS